MALVSGLGHERTVTSTAAPPLAINVYFASGAKVFRKITVGHYVKIGANAVIYPDIPNMAGIHDCLYEKYWGYSLYALF